ncbi:RICIN domain-containing protein [Streptomyces albidoflavus]
MKRSTNRLLLVLGLITALLGGLTAGPATAADDPPQRIVNYQTGGSLMPYNFGNTPVTAFTSSPTIRPVRAVAITGRSRSVGGGSKIIRNTKTGKCLKPGKPYGGKTSVEQWTCNYTPEFQWRLTPSGFGTWKITSVASRQALAPLRGNHTYERVVLEPDTNIAKQRWSITPLY